MTGSRQLLPWKWFPRGHQGVKARPGTQQSTPATAWGSRCAAPQPIAGHAFQQRLHLIPL
ncbi:hypothetical protein NEUTE2DRAFT_127239 [Neurospora tetrasperma FGSC 2509]|nr:hypothetical protein NEUTE2DRAFT_127239 [Neurospora tetrasperma FGSC 2509]